MQFHLYIFFTMFYVHSFFVFVFLFILLIWCPIVVSQHLPKSDKRGWLIRWNWYNGFVLLELNIGHDICRHLRLLQGFPTFLSPCPPSVFRQMNMYPFSISTGKHVPIQHFYRRACTLKIYYDYILSWLFIDIFNNKHIMIFENNIHRYMCKYLEINYMQIHFALLLITLNEPLRIGKRTPGGTCTPGWEPLG